VICWIVRLWLNDGFDHIKVYLFVTRIVDSCTVVDVDSCLRPEQESVAVDCIYYGCKSVVISGVLYVHRVAE
jgi:hypothetical protein